MTGPQVDYEAAASRYEGGRALRAEVLDRWRRAAIPGGRAPARVLDLGAGTGIFSRAWASWGARTVFAVEPSPAMRAEAVRMDPRSVVHVAGAAEALPLAPRSVDVAWLSAVVHHFRDRPAALAELRRVLTPGGTLHLRGWFPDRGQVTVLSFAPPAGIERARARMPTAEALAAAAVAAGFTPVAAEEVEEPSLAAGSEAAAGWVLRMRHADTLLAALTDGEIAATVAALRAHGDAPLPPAVLSLLTFAAPR